ncbi:hypothetical protein GMOD_00006135 [Pyrenophora seminiperda CCB06]|uniref:Uncharacterized protein n=1 Tax=Pyrenophora seminiperda CCB06 TaxID=1302712 RepID=A0A3M7M4M1_9PLEO|nr:hypothetical protein GMOD_00006135 [Pyrenophora seminiperda CCB06]
MRHHACNLCCLAREAACLQYDVLLGERHKWVSERRCAQRRGCGDESFGEPSTRVDAPTRDCITTFLYDKLQYRDKRYIE